MSKKRKARYAVAALLLSETAACVPICDPVPPPPAQTAMAATRTAQAGGAGITPTRTPGPPPICDPVPPPPALTGIAATAAARLTATTAARPALTTPQVSPTGTITTTRTPTRAPTPVTTRTPPPICDPVPAPPSSSSRAPAATGTPVTAETSGQSGVAAEGAPAVGSVLPLQQRLRLSIVPVPGEEHVYRAEANFPATDLRWTASAGQLEACEAGMRWHPPACRGSFLIQAVADAGASGVAVAALVVALSG